MTTLAPTGCPLTRRVLLRSSRADSEEQKAGVGRIASEDEGREWELSAYNRVLAVGIIKVE